MYPDSIAASVLQRCKLLTNERNSFQPYQSPPMCESEATKHASKHECDVFKRPKELKR